MYTIYCIEPDDQIVKIALKTLAGNDQVYLPPTNGNYVLVTHNKVETVGDGNPEKNVAVLLGHGSPNGVSGQKTFKLFNEKLLATHRLDVAPDRIFVVSCSTAGEGDLFMYGSFARSVKDSFPKTPVWASEQEVDAHTLSGDWQKI